jgi:hypothetical protein
MMEPNEMTAAVKALEVSHNADMATAVAALAAEVAKVDILRIEVHRLRRVSHWTAVGLWVFSLTDAAMLAYLVSGGRG